MLGITGLKTCGGLVGLAMLLLTADAASSQSWIEPSERFGYSVRLEPREGSVKLNKYQDWILTIQRETGSPLDGARIVIGGGMPGHGHGLPSAPQVTAQLGAGRYLVEGLRFNMSGLWFVAFGIETEAGRDRVVFELQLERWTDGERAILSSLYLGADVRPGPSPSNRYADDGQAAELGEKLFFDTRLSVDGSLSCASCHQPERYFTDGVDRAEGVARAGRNTPTIIGAGFQEWFYWDGRRDSLWSQALVPFEAPDEMGNSRTAVVRTILNDAEYRNRYEAVFGPFPERFDAAAIPQRAGPLGDSAMRREWQALDAELQRDVNLIYVNLGKAIAAYERSLPVPQSRFDRYVEALTAGDDQAERLLTADERAGLELFVDAERTHCMRCHNGRFFTNGGFSNIGTGTFTGDNLDFGRVFGLRSALTDEFNCLGNFSDASPDDCIHMRFLNRDAHVPMEGAFKIPGLRNVAATAPYMHDGRFPTLAAVIEYYRNPPDSAGTHELIALDISDREARQLVAFLESLSPGEVTATEDAKAESGHSHHAH